MDEHSDEQRSDNAVLTHELLSALLELVTDRSPAAMAAVPDLVGRVSGAVGARLFVADYGLRGLRQLTAGGVAATLIDVEGTAAGRAFMTGGVVRVEDPPHVALWMPLLDGRERLGVVELVVEKESEPTPAALDSMMCALALVVVSRRRYTDVWHRARRSAPLTGAAEAQWDLLPPANAATDEAAISGMLEPAYSVAGDAFDYAFNPGTLDFAIVDAAGHGIGAVLMSMLAVNSLRNSRREQVPLDEAYERVDGLIAAHFARRSFVTGQIGALSLPDGELTLVNAGHPPPMLFRDGRYIGPLACTPSRPMGLGGVVVEVARHQLQRGDRVLLHTDGITESRSPHGEFLGDERLADLMVRSALDGLPAAETARRVAGRVLEFVGPRGLRDDATVMIIDYLGRSQA